MSCTKFSNIDMNTLFTLEQNENCIHNVFAKINNTTAYSLLSSYKTQMFNPDTEVHVINPDEYKLYINRAGKICIEPNLIKVMV